MMTASRKRIPNHIMKEIKEKSDSMTYDHLWESNDLLMVDNVRFMHGRRSFQKNVKRDIVIVQSESSKLSLMELLLAQLTKLDLKKNL